MDKVSEISSSKLSDAIINYRQWGEMYYNVQNYGVFPGGVDVTTSLQALVDKATAENRTAIFFPPGDYRVTAIANDSRIFYVGDNARFIGGYTKTINLIGTNPGPNTGAPNPHAATHVTGGTDVIPNAVAGGNSGLMSGSDKTKLNGIANNANDYTHPTTHPPSIIAQDSNNRFVTDAQITQWNSGTGGGGSGPSFGKVNDIQAASANDSLTIAQGPGISVTTNTTTKTVTITAQGSSAPGAHAPTHLPGGSDPIQTATTSRYGLTTLNDTNTSTATDQALTANAGRVTYEIATALGSTTQVGRVQMYDGIDSTRTDLAATANAVRIAASMGGGGGGGTTAAVTYYVDGVAGSDTNDGLTTATALKTPQVAVDKLYTLSGGKLNHNCVIVVKGGQTYTATLTIQSFSGSGTLTLLGKFSSESSANFSALNGMAFNFCTCPVSVSDITASRIVIKGCAYIEILNFVSTQNNNDGLLVTNGSTVIISSSTISNKSNQAIYCYASRLYVSNVTGSGNAVALRALAAGVIGKNGTVPAATTAESTSGGGVIR